jgi:hypothetical protein
MIPNNRLTIKFPDRETRNKFRRVYSGNSWSHHPNYDGSFTDDETLFGGTIYLYMERNRVKDLTRLRQDVELYKGEIMIGD